MFKPGDKVKVVKKADHYWCPSMDNLIGETAVVFRIDDVFGYPVYIEHESGFGQERDENGNYVYGFWLPYECLELVVEEVKEVKCPRCVDGILEDRTSQGFLGGTYAFRKCVRCGWC